MSKLPPNNLMPSEYQVKCLTPQLIHEEGLVSGDAEEQQNHWVLSSQSRHLTLWYNSFASSPAG